VVEAVRKWQHFLKGRYFTIVADQEAISFMFGQRHHGKIKNTNVGDWNWDNITLIFAINLAFCMLHPIRFLGCVVLRLESSLLERHKSLGHPGCARFYHFIRQRNLPFSS